MAKSENLSKAELIAEYEKVVKALLQFTSSSIEALESK
jgi:hypothetical protein